MIRGGVVCDEPAILLAATMINAITDPTAATAASTLNQKPENRKNSGSRKTLMAFATATSISSQPATSQTEARFNFMDASPAV